SKRAQRASAQASASRSHRRLRARGRTAHRRPRIEVIYRTDRRRAKKIRLWLMQARVGLERAPLCVYAGCKQARIAHRVRKAMASNHNVLAVILGGGAGTRLFPLTHHRSKPAVPLGGKYRLVDIPISNCINSDIIQIFVLTQYNSASLNRHVSRSYRFSRFSEGFVEILAAEQTPDRPDWFQGTADAVRQVMPHIYDWQIDTLLILSGDHLYRMDYRKFLARHFETGADVTVSVVPYGREAAEEFGLLKADEHGRITEFREKPKGE